jgi:hypothetical protein
MIMMNIHRFSNVFLILILSIATIATGFSAVQFAFSQQTLDIKATGGNEAFGGEKMGTITIVPKEHTVHIVANMSAPPPSGKVFEGWLADAGGSDYKLSLGEFSKNGTLDYTATMVNPYTYTQFIVTQEPFEDSDPNAASTLSGAELVSPFGQ